MKIIDIHRYLSDEASAEEKRELERWLEKSEENRRTFEGFREIYNVELGYRHHFDEEAALVKFRKVMNKGSQPLKSIPVKKYSAPRNRNTGIWLKVAAILIAVVGIAIYVATSTDFVSNDTVVEAVSGTTITTDPGEQKSFRLSDGSRIKLNADSEIYISDDYGKEVRRVELIGEAFFEITTVEGLNFEVITSTARVEILGTKFGIRAWKNRNVSLVAVESGKVSVRSINDKIEDTIVLNPGEYSRVEYGMPPTPAQSADIDQYIGWTNQLFVFNETPLKDVLKQLELYFNVQIEIEDSSSIEDPVTARYRNESLKEILEYTSITHGVNFKVKPGTKQ